MRELRIVFWGCLTFQVVPILLFVLLAVLSAQGTVLLPDSLWFMPVIFLVNGIGCLAIITTRFKRILKKIDPGEYEKMQIFRFYPGFNDGLNETTRIFSNKDRNESTKKLTKTYFVICGSLAFVIFAETVVATTVLSWTCPK